MPRVRSDLDPAAYLDDTPHLPNRKTTHGVIILPANLEQVSAGLNRHIPGMFR